MLLGDFKRWRKNIFEKHPWLTARLEFGRLLFGNVFGLLYVRVGMTSLLSSRCSFCGIALEFGSYHSLVTIDFSNCLCLRD